MEMTLHHHQGLHSSGEVLAIKSHVTLGRKKSRSYLPTEKSGTRYKPSVLFEVFIVRIHENRGDTQVKVH